MSPKDIFCPHFKTRGQSLEKNKQEKPRWEQAYVVMYQAMLFSSYHPRRTKDRTHNPHGPAVGTCSSAFKAFSQVEDKRDGAISSCCHPLKAGSEEKHD